MIARKQLLSEIADHIDIVLNQEPGLGEELWNTLCLQHPADIAELLDSLTENQACDLFKMFPTGLSLDVFERCEAELQVHILSTLEDDHCAILLRHMAGDELTYLFDNLPNEKLPHYIRLLQKNQRQQVISWLNFAPKSAGRIMNGDVLSLEKEFTVKHAITVFQALGATKKEVPPRVFVTDNKNILVGYIELEDLILNKPDILIANIMKVNEVVIDANIDQDDVATQMQHYELLAAPVVDTQNHFLGAITAEDIYEVIQEETTEDVYKMSGLAPTDYGYFQMPFWKLIQQRSSWLIGLLLLQSTSSYIMSFYQATIQHHTFFTLFLGMLIGTGGNAGNQSATLVIRGIAMGEIDRKNALRVLFRELRVALALGGLLIIATFARVYMAEHNFMASLTMSVACFLIVLASISIGTLMPILFERFNIDPAHSAAPFIATVMDILGVFILCNVSYYLLGS